MSWNEQYERLNKPWGEKPSELAVLAVDYLQSNASISSKHTILDIGCGYGRDSFYLHEQLGCKVTGIDTAKRAIELANASRGATRHKDVNFSCANFMELKTKRCDILFASNLYQILQADERTEFRKKVLQTIKRDGVLFLSTHSVSDPEHSGKGTPHPSKPNSYRDKIYLHLCTLEELRQDFGFLDIKTLREHEYLEPRADGTTHHHISWILIGKYLKNP